MALSLDILKRRLRRSTWLPLSIMSAFYLISVVVVLQRQYTSQLESTKYALSDLVFSQETSFAQEVYLNLETAIDIRIRKIVKDWAVKHPNMEVCVSMSLLNGPSTGKNFEGCSPKLANQGIIQKGLTEERQIRIGEKNLATLRFSLVRPTAFLDLFPPLILVSLFLSLVIAFVSYQIIIRRIEKIILNPLLAKLSEEERNTAIANTTKMLAHDIRKPFSIIRLALEKLTSSRHPQVREVGEEIAGDVVTSLDSVDSMLSDILDISRNMEPELEEASMGDLIEQAVSTVTRLFPDAKISITYDFHHRYLSQERSVVVVDDFERNLRVDLDPLPAQVTILSDPDGADVSINGVSVGKTPLRSYKIQPGKMNFELSLPGYVTDRGTVDADPDERKMLPLVKLMPISELEKKKHAEQEERERNERAEVDQKENPPWRLFLGIGLGSGASSIPNAWANSHESSDYYACCALIDVGLERKIGDFVALRFKYNYQFNWQGYDSSFLGEMNEGTPNTSKNFVTGSSRHEASLAVPFFIGTHFYAGPEFGLSFSSVTQTTRTYDGNGVGSWGSSSSQSFQQTFFGAVLGVEGAFRDAYGFYVNGALRQYGSGGGYSGTTSYQGSIGFLLGF